MGVIRVLQLGGLQCSATSDQRESDRIVAGIGRALDEYAKVSGQRSPPKVDYVCVCGGVTRDASPAGFAAGTDLLDRILDEFSVPRDRNRVAVAPGRGDVPRSGRRRDDAAFRAFHEAYFKRPPRLPGRDDVRVDLCIYKDLTLVCVPYWNGDDAATLYKDLHTALNACTQDARFRRYKTLINASPLLLLSEETPLLNEKLRQKVEAASRSTSSKLGLRPTLHLVGTGMLRQVQPQPLGFHFTTICAGGQSANGAPLQMNVLEFRERTSGSAEYDVAGIRLYSSSEWNASDGPSLAPGQVVVHPDESASTLHTENVMTQERLEEKMRRSGTDVAVVTGPPSTGKHEFAKHLDECKKFLGKDVVAQLVSGSASRGAAETVEKLRIELRKEAALREKVASSCIAWSSEATGLRTPHYISEAWPRLDAEWRLIVIQIRHAPFSAVAGDPDKYLEELMRSAVGMTGGKSKTFVILFLPGLSDGQISLLEHDWSIAVMKLGQLDHEPFGLLLNRKQSCQPLCPEAVKALSGRYAGYAHVFFREGERLFSGWRGSSPITETSSDNLIDDILSSEHARREAKRFHDYWSARDTQCGRLLASLRERAQRELTQGKRPSDVSLEVTDDLVRQSWQTGDSSENAGRSALLAEACREIFVEENGKRHLATPFPFLTPLPLERRAHVYRVFIAYSEGVAEHACALQERLEEHARSVGAKAVVYAWKRGKPRNAAEWNQKLVACPNLVWIHAGGEATLNIEDEIALWRREHNGTKRGRMFKVSFGDAPVEWPKSLAPNEYEQCYADASAFVASKFDELLASADHAERVP